LGRVGVAEISIPAPLAMAPPTASASAPRGNPILIALSLFALYVIWGSSYLFAKLALEGFPPLMLSGLRFYLAGTILFLFCVSAGTPMPSLRAAGNAFAMGLLMLAVGNGGLVIAVQYVSTGLVAVSFASIPLWTALFGGLIQKWPRPLEWLALLVGMAGVVLLGLESDFHGSVAGTMGIVAAALAWSLGSVLIPRLDLPQGLMSPAVQMLTSGMTLILVSQFIGEQLINFPSGKSLAAVAALIAGPSLTGFTAHGYLLRHQVRPIVANSFAYVNPAVAIGLGIAFLGESLRIIGIVAMVVILVGVTLLGLTKAEE
jgi:drug/metabolite transporter (DMT)-like permease